MLNLLIAIMGDRYDAVQNQAELYAAEGETTTGQCPTG